MRIGEQSGHRFGPADVVSVFSGQSQQDLRARISIRVKRMIESVQRLSFGSDLVKVIVMGLTRQVGDQCPFHDMCGTTDRSPQMRADRRRDAVEKRRRRGCCRACGQCGRREFVIGANNQQGIDRFDRIARCSRAAGPQCPCGYSLVRSTGNVGSRVR